MVHRTLEHIKLYGARMDVNLNHMNIFRRTKKKFMAIVLIPTLLSILRQFLTHICTPTLRTLSRESFTDNDCYTCAPLVSFLLLIFVTEFFLKKNQYIQVDVLFYYRSAFYNITSPLCFQPSPVQVQPF